MMGIKIEGPSILLLDNQSVVINTTFPSSLLKKKHNAIAYHKVREAVAAGVVKVVHIRSSMNRADVLTKPLNPGQHYNLLKDILFTRKEYSEN